MRWLQWAFRAGRVFPAPGGVHAMCVIPGGALLVTGAADDGGVRVWDLRRGKLAGEPLHTLSPTIYSVAATADGSTIVTTGTGVLEVWDRRAGRRVYDPLRLHAARADVTIPLACHAAVTPDGSAIVALGYDGRLWFVDLPSGEPVNEPVDAHPLGMGVWVSPDGAKVITTGTARPAREGHTLRIPDGTGTLRVWDTHTGQAAGDPIPLENNFLSGLTFTPDSAKIVTSDLAGRIRVRPLGEPGQPAGGTVKAHGHGGVIGVAVTPDGQRVISAGRNRLLHIWTVGEPVEAGQTVPLTMKNVTCMALMADGKCAITGSAFERNLEVAGLLA